MPGLLARAVRAHGGRPLRHGLVAGLAVALVAAGGSGAAYAVWTASTSVSGSATTATLTVTAANFGAFTITNEDIPAAGSSAIVETSTVTVKNTTTTSSTQGLPVTLASQTPSSDTGGVAALADVAIWSVGDGGTCTRTTAVPSGTPTGKWNTVVTSASVGLATGDSTNFCVRTSIDRTAAGIASGTRSFVPRATATVTAGTNAAYTASATVTGTASGTSRVYSRAVVSNAYWQKLTSVSTSRCVDLSANNTQIVSATCGTSTDFSQQWQFLGDPVNAGYVEFKPRSLTTQRIDNGGTLTVGAGTTAAADLTVASGAGADRQLWQAQTHPSGGIQIVSKQSGLCLTTPAAANAQFTQTVCADLNTQRFTVTQGARIELDNVTCSYTATAITYNWAATGTGGYTIQGKYLGQWYTVGANNDVNGTTITVPMQSYYPDGNFDVRIVDSTGISVRDGSATIKNNKFTGCS